MTNKKGRRKGHKGKIKHHDPIPSSPDRAQEITASVGLSSSVPSGSNGRYAKPSSPRDDDYLASPSTTSLLPGHESLPRRGGQGDEINTRPPGEQAPRRTLALDDGRSRKRPMECLDSSPEDEDGRSSKRFTEDQDGCSSDSSSENYHRFSSVDAAQRILADDNCKNDVVSKIKEICKPHFGYLRSIRNLRDFFKKHRLVRPVKIFGGKMTIMFVTTKGRLLAQAMMDVIRECHSQNRSWNGTFDFEHIWIIEPWESKAPFMTILNNTVSFEGGPLLQAMANDLDNAARILKDLYMVGGQDYPVYFEAFIEILKNVKKELAMNQPAFIEYLRYHPAIMPSTGRSTFIFKLKSISTWSIMKLKSSAYPYDWKTVVTSEIGSKKIRELIKSKKITSNKSHDDIISVLNTVYYHKNNYENTVHGLIRFMRNVLEHGKEHDDRVIHGYELELYLAKMFHKFLPVTLQDMLMSGKIEEYVGEDWSSYKISSWNYWEPAWSTD